jgi:hypothetical protein
VACRSVILQALGKVVSHLPKTNKENGNPWLTGELKTMARKKRKSKAVENGLKRAAALTAIDPKLDLGNGLTLDGYNTAIKAHEDDVDGYNSDLSDLDARLTGIKANEKTLAQLSVRMLKGVASKFGEDSDEYEKAGGKRTSERKRPVRQSKAAVAGK